MRSLKRNVRQMNFCYWHIKTKENPEGTDCSAHLHEARVFECPYNKEEAKLKCSDFKLTKSKQQHSKYLFIKKKA